MPRKNENVPKRTYTKKNKKNTVLDNEKMDIDSNKNIKFEK